MTKRPELLGIAFPKSGLTPDAHSVTTSQYQGDAGSVVYGRLVFKPEPALVKRHPKDG
jgi:hypothetical protein